ncbi:trypsin-1-like [Diabrotica virgifera virgifera]|uniref:Peptidase S1 domain-containing protein n=1 Tax=Diabrotica virgifera virgifera TaxID=50390 RepID=A0ABM5L8A8_DIAVI|nr:trypsin-1-like [Diabrotica virgifera virgifera]
MILELVWNVDVILGNNYRIVGGNDTTIEQHPWIVSIQFLRVHFCGGALVDEETVITAAHCFNDVSGRITILAGTADLTQEGTSIKVKSILIHENYNPDVGSLDHDIAILKLSEKITFSDKIQPINLPEEDIDVPKDTKVSTAGWGVTEEGGTTSSDILLEINIKIVDRQTCKKLLEEQSEVTERMICAGDLKGGVDTCQNDSGGPLELNTTLIGIVSWGYGCGEAGYPGVYTHVARFRSWIKQHAGV